jgi:oxygen-independent coproporphyrinogen-3 oxidase
MPILFDKETILKFDKPGPRYTSYPTAPEWSESVKAPVYEQQLRKFGQSDKTLSLYIHIPFCQSLCYFCACNVAIRRQDEKYGDEYLEYLFKEIELVRRHIGGKKKVRQFHWGGGTPTFLTEGQIERLFRHIQKNFEIDPSGEIAIEIDPRTIDKSKVKKLRELGFNRVSMGVQDFEETVQKSINRVQPFEMVQEFYDWCRELDFQSINFDLIYGLPNQTVATFEETVRRVIMLEPDRIALYSFAHVPWLKKHQNKIDPARLPSTDEKLDIFLKARGLFLNHGYEAIAMDHFALKDDEMAVAFREGTLYRNFMGYTVKPADEFIGLGVSSIGFLENAFIQNHRTIPAYFAALKDNELPVERGKMLSTDDRIRQWVISALMCRFFIGKEEFKRRFQVVFDEYFAEEQSHLRQCRQDGLLAVSMEKLEVTELGKIFIRNICMGFDWYLRQKNAHQRFSKTI